MLYSSNEDNLMFERKLKRVSLIAIQILIIVLITPVASAAPGQHQWGASYLEWDGALLNQDTSVTQSIQPLEISSEMYWEMGWNWQEIRSGGYAGIQTNGVLATKEGKQGARSDVAIFSIWNAAQARTGSSGGCLAFGGEGIGFSCRIPIKVTPGNVYTITISGVTDTSGRWWKATFIDQNKNLEEVIGLIEAPRSNLTSTNWNNFIEYFGPAVPCEKVGEATAKFFTPISSSESVQFYSPRFSRPALACVHSSADTPPKGYVGDAIMHFGGPIQRPSTESMPFTKTKAQQEKELKLAEISIGSSVKKKTTITCLKGKLVKKVKATKPKCPAGYRKKK